MNVAVIGLGKLGACIAAAYSAAGHKVVGVDVDQTRCDLLNTGVAPVLEPGLREQLRAHPFLATTDTARAVRSTDAAVVIVPTPSKADGSFSNRNVIAAVTEIGRALRTKNTAYTVIIASTVMPGSCAGPIRRALEDAAGKEVGLCYSPEFVALGSVMKDLADPDVILIGEGDYKSGLVLRDLTSSVAPMAPMVTLTLTEAEIAKIAINTYVTTKISYANMVGELSTAYGANGTKVLEAVGRDSRIGHKYLRTGAAYGGPCFPRDTEAMRVAALDRGVNVWLPGAARATNHHQSSRILRELMRLHVNNVGIVGLAYKPGTSIPDDSASLELAQRLPTFNVAGWDPLVEVPKLSVDSFTTLLQCSDALVLMHDSEDLAQKCLRSVLQDPSLHVIDVWHVIDDHERVITL